MVITTPQISQFSPSLTASLRTSLSQIYSINISRINITQKPNDEYQNVDGELILSISQSTGTEPEHSAIIYNLTQEFQNTDKLNNYLAGSNLTVKTPSIKTLTFNETVGSVTGCYKNQGSSLALLFGTIDSCIKNQGSSSNNIGTASPTVGIVVGVVIAVIASVVIMSGIAMLIPSVRKKIFVAVKF